MPVTTCVFDAYGTLFDVAAAARIAAAEPGREAFAAKWPAISSTWRLKQLQYTWLRATAGVHCGFWQVTQEGLDYALEAHGMAGGDLRERLLQLYWELQAYPEVPGMLRELKMEGFQTAILSNGSPDMLRGAVDNAGIGDVLDAVLSVESVGVFKPDPAVYDLVGQYFGCPRSEVLFVSSNCWDGCAASGHGFHAVWANRAGEPMDRLPWKPAQVVSDLTPIPDIAANA
jgi:2-haloacid dehalogenase